MADAATMVPPVTSSRSEGLGAVGMERMMLQLPPLMAKEVLFETFHLKAPGQEKLRKTADGRLRHLLREGWHEVSRQEAGADAIRIQFVREGATRKLDPLRKVPEPPPRRERRDDRGGRGGGGGGRGGGPPRGGGGRGGGAPGGGGGRPPEGGGAPPPAPPA
jgi:uncharacterized membrane protein YgcG